MPYEELKERVLAMVKCIVGAEKFDTMKFDDAWLQAIHQDKTDKRNETVLAYAWMEEYNKRQNVEAPQLPTV